MGPSFRLLSGASLAIVLLGLNGAARADDVQATCNPTTDPFPEVDAIRALDSPIGAMPDADRALPSPKPSPTPSPTPSSVPDDESEIDVVAGMDVNKLEKVAEHQAIVPRWDSRGRFRGKGDQSKGLCMQAVKDTLTGIGAIPSPKALPAGSAIEAHRNGLLKKLGFRNIIGEGVTSTTAPIGSVLVYSGGSKGYGHIEIRVAEDQYCSDFCSARPIDRYANRKLVGVYVKEKGISTSEDLRKIRDAELLFPPATTDLLYPILKAPTLPKTITAPPKIVIPSPTPQPPKGKRRQ